MLKSSIYYFLKGTLAIIVITVLLTGCNTTRYVPEDKYLLSRVKLKIDNKSIKKDELRYYIRQRENKRLFGFKLYLGLYNLSNIKKNNWFQRYLRKIGEDPVIWDPQMTERTVKQLMLYMKMKGYYNAVVSDSVKLIDKKAYIIYRIKSNSPYRIRNINYSFEDSTIMPVLLKDTINTLIKRKSLLDEDVLKNECSRIETYLKNKGYYQFLKDYIRFEFEVDTLTNPNMVDLTLIVRNVTDLQSIQPNPQAYKLYKINKVLITNDPGFSVSPITNIHSAKKDTIIKSGVEFIYPDNFWVNPSTILLQNYLYPGKLYSLKDVEETKKHLSALNTFSLVNIYFDELPQSDTSEFNYLDCHIRLTSLNIQSYALTGELTSTSSNFLLGGDIGINYQHKSLLGNAENLNLKLTGGKAWVQNGGVKQSTLDLGSAASINVPKFLFPINTSPELVKIYNPKTDFAVSFNFTKLTELIDRDFNSSFGYNWKSGPYITHTIKPIEFSWLDVNITNYDYYNDYIKNTYLVNIYTSQYILGSAYNFTYNNQVAQMIKDYHYFKWNFEIAGNLLTLINDVLKNSKDKGQFLDYYPLFGKQYSQYLKTDCEFMYDHYIDLNNSVAYRAFAGLAVPYGNADVIPLEKEYYSGGPNSIRGWNPRFLGPGSYQFGDTGNLTKYFPNNTGDIKLETNIEYRFKLFWDFEGALFTDAGNIWAITQAPTDTRQGILFKWDKFYKDLAVSSGVGVRLNVTYFIIRLDFAAKMKNPAQDPGKRWIFQDIRQPANQTLINWGLAIGYPF